MAPVQRGAQGFLARQGGSASRREQAEIGAELRQHAAHAQVADLRRGQLDRQGDTVQAAAQFTGNRQLTVGQLESVLAGPGALHQQLQGGEAQGLFPVLGADWRRAFQRSNAADIFVLDAQGFPAGRQDVQAWARLQQGFGEDGDDFDQVFAVIQHQQHLSSGQEVRQIVERLVAGAGQLERRGQFRGHRCGFVERCQVEQVYALRVVLQEQFGHVQGHRGLAYPPRSHEGYQALFAYQLHQPGQHLGAADHAAQVRGQIAWRRALLHACTSVFNVLPRERGDQAVAALRYVDDVALATVTIPQRLAQGGHMHAQVDLFDHAVRPDPRDQLILADHRAGVLQQHQQDVHRTAAKTQGPVDLEHQASVWIDPVGAQRDDSLAGNGRWLAHALSCIRRWF